MRYQPLTSPCTENNWNGICVGVFPPGIGVCSMKSRRKVWTVASKSSELSMAKCAADGAASFVVRPAA